MNFMSLFNELPIAFPWYGKKEQQNRYQENSWAVCDFKLITPFNTLLPFQFVKPLTLFPTTWTIRNANTEAIIYDITSSLPIPQVGLDGGKHYFYFGGVPLSDESGFLGMAPGYYFSEITFASGEVWTSEMFYVPEDSFDIDLDQNINYLKLEWWNDTDIRPIFYNNADPGDPKPVFRNVIYLDTFITASEPEVTIDGEKDGSDEVIPTFKKVVISYRITLLVPDYLKKALMVMQIHDHVQITTKNGVRSGEVLKVVVSSQLEANGGLSTVDIVFEDTVAMVQKNCGDNLIFD